MSTTIFCNFEQQDMADLAVGRLRASSLAIRSIHYVGGFKHNKEHDVAVGFTGAVAGTAGFGFNGALDNQAQLPVAILAARDTEDVTIPSPPVTLKIVCADSAAAAVKSKLINMNAYQIITAR